MSSSLHFEYDESEGFLKYNGTSISLSDPRAFELISKAWLRCGWDTKYVYSFTWLGRPIIQLPEDMFRIQELIFSLKPDLIIETGVAHGGSLIFYASLCTTIGKGRIVGVDIDIRPHNRNEIENHSLSSLINLIEGSSTSEAVQKELQLLIRPSDNILVLLDSNHSYKHVLSELNLYSQYVKPGGYIIACDGIMKDLVGAPRSDSDWSWNNPIDAVQEFLSCNPSFELVQPTFPFNEGVITKPVTYWPSSYLRRTH